MYVKFVGEGGGAFKCDCVSFEGLKYQWGGGGGRLNGYNLLLPTNVHQLPLNKYKGTVSREFTPVLVIYLCIGIYF